MDLDDLDGAGGVYGYEVRQARKWGLVLGERVKLCSIRSQVLRVKRRTKTNLRLRCAYCHGDDR